MVYVSLKGEDFLNIVLFLLSKLLQLHRGTTDVFLRGLHLAKELLVFATKCLDSGLETLYLQARVSVVCQDVFLL